MTTDSLNQWILVPAIAGAVALVLALVLFLRVRSLPEGNDTMKRIAGYIREGAMAFLSAEYKVLAIYAVVVFGAMAMAWKPRMGTDWSTSSSGIMAFSAARYLAASAAKKQPPSSPNSRRTFADGPPLQ